MKNNWKPIVITVGVILVLILAFASGNNKKQETTSEYSNDSSVILSNAEKESASVTDEEKKEFPQIDVDTYLEYLEESDPKIILLARPTCHYCQIAEPIIQKIAKNYNLNIYYLNTDNFTDSSETDFVQSNDAFKEGFGTPYLFIVQNGGIVDSVDGLTDSAHYLEFFTRNGFIES